MLACGMLATYAGRELALMDLSRRGAMGSDWRGVGEMAGCRTLDSYLFQGWGNIKSCIMQLLIFS